MKLSSGKRIGQSGQELVTAVVFSLTLHLLAFAAVVFTITVTPKTHIPPLYNVKLVGLPADLSQPAPTTPAAAPAVPQQPPTTKKEATRERKSAMRKGSMPELTSKLPAKKEPGKSEETPEESVQAAPPGLGSGQGQNVTVAATQQNFKFAWYLEVVKEKIGQNWRPSPDAPDAKARVVFTVNRSGWVGDVNLVAEHSKGTFGFKQAAIRAIRASSPLPPLPEEFSKQTLEFSVDLTAVE